MRPLDLLVGRSIPSSSISRAFVRTVRSDVRPPGTGVDEPLTRVAASDVGHAGICPPPMTVHEALRSQSVDGFTDRVATHAIVIGPCTIGREPVDDVARIDPVFEILEDLAPERTRRPNLRRRAHAAPVTSRPTWSRRSSESSIRTGVRPARTSSEAAIDAR